MRQAVALGLLHGPAEVLPVSSSGHITLVPFLRGWDWQEIDPAARKRFEVALHAGALVGLAIAARGELTGAYTARRLARVIVPAVLPAALAGVLGQEAIERRLGTPPTIAAGLLGGSLAMAVADHSRRPRADARGDAGVIDGIALGTAQAVALIPGVSRSGAARTVARWRGFSPIEAEALSNAVGMPITLGALALKGREALGSGRGEWVPLSAGALAAFASTLVSGSLTRRLGRSRSLLPYAAYRVAVAAAVVRRLRQNASDDRRLRRGRR